MSTLTTRKRYLLAIAFFTFLFMGLIWLGSYLLSINSRQFGIAAFLFAFAAAFGQIASLALYLRHKMYAQASAQQQKGKHHHE